jgi:hypothetical protein
MIEALHTGTIANAIAVDDMFLLGMLNVAFRGMKDDVYIQSRQSAELFKVAHFRAKNKTTQILIIEMLFAYDSVLFVNSAEDIQNVVDAFSNGSKKFGLKIHNSKTERRIFWLMETS